MGLDASRFTSVMLQWFAAVDSDGQRRWCMRTPRAWLTVCLLHFCRLPPILSSIIGWALWLVTRDVIILAIVRVQRMYCCYSCCCLPFLTTQSRHRLFAPLLHPPITSYSLML